MLHLSCEKLGNTDSNPPGFPVWSCRYPTMLKLESFDNGIRRKAIRQCASSFIQRPDVREYIFQSKGNRCYLCGCDATQIDHKIPVARFALDRSLDIAKLNEYDNLFPVCKRCNISKRDNLI